MQQILIVIYVIVSALLTLVILLQPGKGGGMGAIGGGGGGTVFGSRGAVGFLGNLTGWLAAVFMVLALVLARFSLEGSSVAPMAEAKASETQEVDDAATGTTGIEVKGQVPPAEVPPAEAAPADAEAAPAKANEGSE